MLGALRRSGARRGGGGRPGLGAGPTITLRLAARQDAARIAWLAELAGEPVPRGALLVAEVDGQLWAARSLVGERVLADPFRPVAELAPLLAMRADQLAD
jgi:hypothetical protein